MNIEQLEAEKQSLLKKANELAAIKKRLYSDMDIESPMSADEKALNKEIAALFSRINQIVREKRGMAAIC